MVIMTHPKDIPADKINQDTRIAYETIGARHDNGDLYVTHFQTLIFHYDAATQTVTLKNGGFQSKTTKDRLNQLMRRFGFCVYQSKKVWFVEHCDNGKKPMEFEEGMKVFVG